MPALVTRRRAIVLLVSAGVALAVAILLEARTPARPSADPDLGTRTVQAGDVKVAMTALSLDASGARFRIVLDTHAGSLDLDVARAAQLRVNDALADPGTWAGTGPGGHHREGTLAFTTAVPTRAAVELRVTGLPAGVAATWMAP